MFFLHRAMISLAWWSGDHVGPSDNRDLNSRVNTKERKFKQ